MEDIITCPLCGDDMLHTAHTDEKRTDAFKTTHTWSCAECPFVGLEFHLDHNLEALGTILGVKAKKEN